MEKAAGSLTVKKGKDLNKEHFQKALADLEAKIEENAKGFWVTGEALLEIRERKLYEHSDPPYETFRDYANGRWGYISRAYQLAAATEIRQAMIECGLQNPDSFSEREYRLDFKSIKKLMKTSKDEKLKELLKGKELSHDELKEGLAKLLPAPKAKKLTAEELEKLRKGRLDKLVALVHNRFEQLCEKSKLKMSWESFVGILEKGKASE